MLVEMLNIEEKDFLQTDKRSWTKLILKTKKMSCCFSKNKERKNTNLFFIFF
jgi:hypothetical protein